MTDENPNPGSEESPAAKAAEEKAREVKAAVKALGPQDKLILFGSAALFVLFFLPWYRMSANVMGISQSVNGLHGVLAWLGWLAAGAATFFVLANMRLLGSLPGGLRQVAANPAILVALTALALLAGPIYFWSQITEPTAEFMKMAGVSIGKTFFFWLAFLAGLAAAGGAVWKLTEARKAATS